MADGTRPCTGLDPVSVVAAVASHLVESGQISEQSVERLVELMERFAGFVLGCGIQHLGAVDRRLAQRFISAPTTQGAHPSPSVRHLRRCAVRLLFRLARELGLLDVDPTLYLGLPARVPPAPRPLSDEEVERCRAASVYDFDATRLPAAWALAEAGVRTAELANITVKNLDLDSAVVHAHGCRSAAPRRAPLTNWGAVQLRRRVAHLAHEPATPVTYSGEGSEKSKQAASCVAITATLTRAGLADDPLVRPVSVAAWAGRKILERTGRIEDVAAGLGMRSLDRAARLVGLEDTRGG